MIPFRNDPTTEVDDQVFLMQAKTERLVAIINASTLPFALLVCAILTVWSSSAAISEESRRRVDDYVGMTLSGVLGASVFGSVLRRNPQPRRISQTNVQFGDRISGSEEVQED